MRNLKKTLCLVLALVFVLGLCTVGAVNGTEFDDQDEILYDTAVKAMSGLGILVGDDNDGDGKNEFRPTDNVTRAEAAKIIAYIVVGAEAEKWPARQVFDDVPADHWAAKYITYCQYNGIIAGYGNGKFGPSDPVTQAQFCRMLLAACGYGLKDEFIGPSWDQNVAKLAMQTKILKNLVSVDWDAPASREETALLGYNTMMEVPQVVLSKDTSDYVWKTVGGNTFANATWDLTTEEGIIVSNKANDSKALGTVLVNGTQSEPYYVTEEDQNGDLLGHYVKITFRMEKIKGQDVAVAYYVDDECTEVVGGATLTKAKIEDTVTFDYGDRNDALFPAAINAMNPGTFVLNGDGAIVAYKLAGYFLSILTINATTGAASINDPVNGAVEVKAPEGAKDGEVFTVVRLGDVYNLLPCSKTEKVAISQKQKDAFNAYHYNNMSVNATSASNIAGFTVAGLTTIAKATDQLKLNYTYTLYFDAYGKVYAFADEKAVGEAEATNYVFYITNYKLQDSFGSDVLYAQVIKSDGTVDSKVKINATTKTYLNTNGQGIYVTGTAADYTTTFTKVTPAKEGMTEGAAWAGKTADPKIDFSQADFILWNGYDKAYCDASVGGEPAIDTVADPSLVYYVYKTETIGTVEVKKVQTVWYDNAAYTYSKNSYVYIINNDVKESKLVGETPTKFWNGYKDGVKMDDLYFAKNSTVVKDSTAAKTGFYEYAEAATGGYILQGLTGATAKSIYLTAKDTATGYILNGKLYANDDANKRGMDLTDVKIVKLTSPYDAVASKVNVSSASALLTALNNYDVRIWFVMVTPNAKTASIGGATIYVTEIYEK